MTAIVQYVEALDATGERMLRNLRSFYSWVHVIPQGPSHFEVQLMHPTIVAGTGRQHLEALLDAQYPVWRNHVRLP